MKALELIALVVFLAIFILAGAEMSARESRERVSPEVQLALAQYEIERDACYSACLTDMECHLCPE